jgi:hypothetical protein
MKTEKEMNKIKSLAEEEMDAHKHWAKNKKYPDKTYTEQASTLDTFCPSPENPTCSTCECEFDLDEEGGTRGEFGIIPVAFCPTCLSSVFDMVEKLK